MATLDPDGLYHLATPTEWADYQAAGEIHPASLDWEGFVHCSWGRQVSGTLDRHFSGVAALVALRLAPAALGDAGIAEEDTAGSGQEFPHVYGTIPVAAVEEILTVRSAEAQP